MATVRVRFPAGLAYPFTGLWVCTGEVDEDILAAVQQIGGGKWSLSGGLKEEKGLGGLGLRGVSGYMDKKREK